MAGRNIRNIVIDDSIIMYFDAAKEYSNRDSIWYDLSRKCGKTSFVNAPGYSTLGGGSYTFNGSNQYMDTSYLQLNVPYTGKTIMTCAYMSPTFNTGLLPLSSAPNYGFRAMFAKPNSTGLTIGRNFNFYIMLNSSGLYQYHFSSEGAAGLSSNLPSTGDNRVGEGRWIIAAFTQDSTGLCSFYHNGVVAGTYSGSLTQYIYDPSRPVDGERIGTSGVNQIGYNGGAWWKGNIATVLVYSRGLTPDEIRKNYNVYSYRYGLPQVQENYYF
jgi:hypothetical protein